MRQIGCRSMSANPEESEKMTNPHRNYLPSISDILSSPNLRTLASRLHPVTLFATATAVLNEMATEARHAASERRMPDIAELAEKIAAQLHLVTEKVVKPSINATGILFHPEYGGPSLPRLAIEQMIKTLQEGASRELPVTLLSAWNSPEDIEDHFPFSKSPLKVLLAELTGVSDAIVFSSHAGAVQTLWNVLGEREENSLRILVSVSDVYERLDGTRLTDLVSGSNISLVPVGTVNRTTLEDYEKYLKQDVPAMILSSDATDGCFEEEKNVPVLSKLVELAQKYDTPLVYDSQWGTFHDTTRFGLQRIPVIREILKQSADLVIFSTGQLNGGPSLTVLAGERSLVGQIRNSRLCAAYAPTGHDLAALETTLALTVTEDQADREIPVRELFSTSPDNLKLRAERIATQLEALEEVAETTVQPGNAMLTPRFPFYKLPTWQVILDLKTRQAREIAQQLLESKPGIAVLVPDMSAHRVCIDLRTLYASQDRLLVESIESQLRNS